MEFSLTEMIYNLSPVELILLLVVGSVLVYIAVSGTHVNSLMFLVVLSASLVGSAIPVAGSVAPLVRWISIFLLFIAVVSRKRFSVSLGVGLFWGYIVLGFVFLLNAISFNWQFQKASLLLLVALAVPLAYGDQTYKSLKSSLMFVCLAATIYCLLNFIFLPSQLSLGEAERFSGSSKGVPSLAMFLGGLLPFTFWGIWGASVKPLRIGCALGFLAGLITLIWTGQRTGTIGGIVGLVPLLLTFMRQKKIGKFLYVISFALLLGYILLQRTSGEFVDFLVSRYSADSGLSGRELIWDEAFSEIAKNPFFGRGIGAAEEMISTSFHNAYLEIWFNTGFLGLLLFGASQLHFLYRTVKLKRIYKDPERRAVLALALGYMIGFAVMCMFESPAAGASNLNLTLYLFLGVLVSNGYTAQARGSQEVSLELHEINA